MTAQRHRLRQWGAAAFALLLIPALTACGFQPLYGSTAYRELAGVEIEAGPERLDFLVQDALSEEFGAGSSPYRLVVATASTELGLGVSAEARARRFSLTVSARYQLLRAGESLLESSAAELVYFDAPAEAYALISARRSAEQQGADALARKIARDVALAIRRAEAGLDREA